LLILEDRSKMRCFNNAQKNYNKSRLLWKLLSSNKMIFLEFCHHIWWSHQLLKLCLFNVLIIVVIRCSSLQPCVCWTINVRHNFRLIILVLHPLLWRTNSLRGMMIWYHTAILLLIIMVIGFIWSYGDCCIVIMVNINYDGLMVQLLRLDKWSCASSCWLLLYLGNILSRLCICLSMAFCCQVLLDRNHFMLLIYHRIMATILLRNNRSETII